MNNLSAEHIIRIFSIHILSDSDSLEEPYVSLFSDLENMFGYNNELHIWQYRSVRWDRCVYGKSLSDLYLLVFDKEEIITIFVSEEKVYLFLMLKYKLTRLHITKLLNWKLKGYFNRDIIVSTYAPYNLDEDYSTDNIGDYEYLRKLTSI